MIAPLKTNDSARFLILCACILTVLQVAILAVLLLRDSGTRGATNDSVAPDCVRDFGFNPKTPRDFSRDCRPAPVNITERA